MRIPDFFPSPADVAGRRVVVTGGSRGLGLVIASAFVNAGARVAIVARDADELHVQAGRMGADVLAIRADVSVPEDNDAVVESVCEVWGGLDVWISNAGISPVLCGPLEISPHTWRSVLDVNVSGAFFGAQAAAKRLPRGGRIIFTGSVLGERPRRGLSAYSTSKGAIVSLAKALALDLADSGITVNVVSPGWFDSPLTEGWQRSDSLTRSVLEHTAAGRWGASEDIAGAFIFLASRAADFITGSVIPVDGGYLCV